jgi:hypothetical protein
MASIHAGWGLLRRSLIAFGRLAGLNASPPVAAMSGTVRTATPLQTQFFIGCCSDRTEAGIKHRDTVTLTALEFCSTQVLDHFGEALAIVQTASNALQAAEPGHAMMERAL